MLINYSHAGVHGTTANLQREASQQAGRSRGPASCLSFPVIDHLMAPSNWAWARNQASTTAGVPVCWAGARPGQRSGYGPGRYARHAHGCPAAGPAPTLYSSPRRIHALTYKQLGQDGLTGAPIYTTVSLSCGMF